MSGVGVKLWPAQGQFWEAQAGWCGVRRDIYRALARNCEVPMLGHRPFQGVALYCRLQADSCELQGQLCRMLARLMS